MYGFLLKFGIFECVPTSHASFGSLKGKGAMKANTGSKMLNHFGRTPYLCEVLNLSTGMMLHRGGKEII